MRDRLRSDTIHGPLCVRPGILTSAKSFKKLPNWRVYANNFSLPLFAYWMPLLRVQIREAATRSTVSSPFCWELASAGPGQSAHNGVRLEVFRRHKRLLRSWRTSARRNLGACLPGSLPTRCLRSCRSKPNRSRQKPRSWSSLHAKHPHHAPPRHTHLRNVSAVHPTFNAVETYDQRYRESALVA